MAGKVFVNYRRDDARDMAARVRDRLAATFGKANVFMDVDNLLAGQRFDRELEKALAQTDVFLAVLGPRWLELLAERQAGGERDYVREEIAGALQRGVVVIPVLIERTPLPRADALPEDIRELVLHQKHVVTHEQFGRDVAGLVEAIRFARKAKSPARSLYSPVALLGALAVMTIVGGGLAAWVGPTLMAPGDAKRQQAAAAKEAEAARVAAVEKARQEELERQQLAMRKAQEDARRADEERKRLEARQKADEEARAKAAEAERQRLAMLQQQQEEEERKRAEAARRREEAEAAKPGRTFRDCPECPEMVVVPAGSFTMGSTPAEIAALEKQYSSEHYRSEGPQRKVTIARPFAVGKFEVTFAEWEACVAGGGCAGNKNPSDMGWGKGKRPVINVSWNDANDYVAWLSRKTGKTYRLLTEAEWEYAARGVTSAAAPSKRYWWGDQASHEYANYGKDQCCAGHKEGRDQWENTAPVGQFPANPFGLHDVHGNVWEWVEDCWHSSYQGAPTDGSAWTTSCTESGRRVLRGGSWDGDPQGLRSADRYGYNTVARDDLNGFRVGRTLTP